MATTPVYTTKLAIVIGAVVSLIAGIAIGATFIAEMIDANSLQEYRNNPKVTSQVVLNDDDAGHRAGWNPGINQIEYEESPGRTITEKREQVQFTISDSSVTKDSIVYAVHTESRQIRLATGVEQGYGMMETSCITVPADGSFTVYCGDYNNNYFPREGSQLKYFVVSPPS